MKYSFFRFLPFAFLMLAGCSGEVKHEYPKDFEDRRAERAGRLTGDGIQLFGHERDKESETAASPIGVNSYLWRATLDTLSFMPLASADPFGGVIITDWHETSGKAGERFKLNVAILDKQLKAGGVRVSAFRQTQDDAGAWRDAAVDSEVARKLEETILTRARELKIQQER